MSSAEDPKYAWDKGVPERPIVLYVQDRKGDFVEIGQPTRSTGQVIRCSPVPGRGGVEYVPDWYGLTRFG